MNKEQLQPQDEHEIIQPPTEESAALGSRRAFLKGVLASIAAFTLPTIAASEAHAQVPDALPSIPVYTVRPYQHLHANFVHDLNAGDASETELGIALQELPMLYYDHNVQNKIVNKDKLNIPTPSAVFELAKFVWLSAKNQVEAAKSRKMMLEKLALAARPGLPQQLRLTQVHDANKPIIDELLPYWVAIEKESNALMKKVQGLVLKERAAAKAKKTPSDAQDDIEDISVLIPTERKSAELTQRHAASFDRYTDIETWISPYSYNCDDVSESPSSPSEILPLEGLKALREYIKWHVDAAVHRKHRYHSIQSFVRLTGKKAQKLLKYDGTRYNDPILNGWLALLSETPDSRTGQKGSVEELLVKMLHIVKLQSEKGASINRCEDRD